MLYCSCSGKDTVGIDLAITGISVHFIYTSYVVSHASDHMNTDLLGDQLLVVILVDLSSGSEISVSL